MAVRLPLEDVKALASLETSCIKKTKGEVVLCVHPLHANDVRRGVAEELNSMSSRYSKTLGGIPVAYESVRISSDGGILHTNPFIHYRVQATFYVFRPEVGSVLEGTVKKKSPRHLSCLVHKMFNVSVPQDVSLKNKWAGSSVEEGDAIKIVITDIDMSFYLPMITGRMDSKITTGKITVFPDDSLSSVKAEGNDSFGEDKGRNVSNDSGISSTEEEEDNGGRKPTAKAKTKTKTGGGKKKKQQLQKEVKTVEVKVLAKKTGVKDKTKEKKKKKKKTLVGDDDGGETEKKENKKKKERKVEKAGKKDNKKGKNAKKGKTETAAKSTPSITDDTRRIKHKRKEDSLKSPEKGEKLKPSKKRKAEDTPENEKKKRKRL